MADKSLGELMSSWRKPGSKTYTYTATKVQAVDSLEGKAIVTVRDDQTGKLVVDNKIDLKEVEANGLPLPNPIELDTK